MSKIDLHDTIAAISTPTGSGGLAVVRLSGNAAIEIVAKGFRGAVDLRRASSHHAHYGKLIASPSDALSEASSEQVVDEVMVTVFRAPRSYTREDVVEITCHGGLYLTRRVLALLLQHGARPAEPGEFTERAFLNGRLDLSQAEAVEDIIAARTERGLVTAMSQLQGTVSSVIKAVRQQLIDFCSLLELELDFVEEDVEFANRDDLGQRLQACIHEISQMSETYQHGRILREGAKVVLAGKPNVGKSSLMNALLRQDRAIVTDVAGTTRDTLEEQLDIRGVLFRVVDTAGIRGSQDTVERIGVERTLGELDRAEILLFIFDGSRALGDDDRQTVQMITDRIGKDSRARKLAVINKADLAQRVGDEDVLELLPDGRVVSVSALKVTGFEGLEDALVELALDGDDGRSDGAVLTNVRHKDAVDKALQCLFSARGSMEKGLSSEFISVDLRQALDHLGEVIGEVTHEHILDNIFSRFCIGK